MVPATKRTFFGIFVAGTIAEIIYFLRFACATTQSMAEPSAPSKPPAMDSFTPNRVVPDRFAPSNTSAMNRFDSVRSALVRFALVRFAYRGGTVASGAPFDVAKSALQKAIRRGDERVAVAALLDILDAVCNGKVSDDNERRCRDRWFTNLMNRLRVISVEDISVADPLAPLIVNNTLQLVERTSDCCALLVALTRYLCAAKKLRLPSDLKSVYSLPPYYKGISYDDPVYQDAMIKIRSMFGVPAVDTPTFPSKLHDIFLHVSEELRKETAKPTSAGYRDKLLSLLDESMTVTSLASPTKLAVIATLRGLIRTMTHAERPIYLYQALLVYHGPEITASVPVIKPAPPAILEEARLLYRAGSYIPSYAHDKHTATGRAQGASLLKFLNEGTVVNNERGRIPEFRAVYTLIKVLLHGKKPQWKSTSFLMQQARTYVDPKTGDMLERGRIPESGSKTSTKSKEVEGRKDDAPEKRVRFDEKTEEATKKQRTIKKPVEKDGLRYDRLPPYLRDAVNARSTVIAQKVTGKFKVPVYLTRRVEGCIMWPGAKGLVIKGPYKRKAAIENVLYFSRRLAIWGEDHFLFAAFSDTDGDWLVTPMIGEFPSKVVMTKYTSWPPTLGPVAVRDGSTTPTMLNFVKRRAKAVFIGPLIPEHMAIYTLKHLSLRFILSIGDSGLHNMIVDTTVSPYVTLGIDIEEFRAEKEVTVLEQALFPKRFVAKGIRANAERSLLAVKPMYLAWLNTLVEEMPESEVTPSKAERSRLVQLLDLANAKQWFCR